MVNRRLVRFFVCAGLEAIAVEDPAEVEQHLPNAQLLAADAFDGDLVVQAIQRYPQVLECYTIMGEMDFLLRIVMPDVYAYERFFFEELSQFPGVQEVHSNIALSEIKSTTALPLSTADP